MSPSSRFHFEWRECDFMRWLNNRNKNKNNKQAINKKRRNKIIILAHGHTDAQIREICTTREQSCKKKQTKKNTGHNNKRYVFGALPLWNQVIVYFKYSCISDAVNLQTLASAALST